MKRIKTIKIPAQKAYAKKVEIFICDFCGKESESVGSGCVSSMIKCCLCGRLACKGWGKHCAKRDPHEIGDYSDYYCPICYKLRFEKYKDVLNGIEGEYERKKTVVLERIKRESLSKSGGG